MLELTTVELDLPGSVTVDPAGVLQLWHRAVPVATTVSMMTRTARSMASTWSARVPSMMTRALLPRASPVTTVTPKWQDCFFDGNSGAGDDQCRYPTECLTGELAPEDEACATTQSCRDNCQPLTPNGCDCFGCCAVQLPGGSQLNVIIGASCSVEKLGDIEACPRCTPSNSCANECGECELCLGQTAADLPASCTPPEPDPIEPNEPDPIDPPPAPTCDGLQACTVSAECESQEYCSLGCCLSIIR